MASSTIQLPDWFKEENYTHRPSSEEGLHEAALAVLDRVPFFQTITARSFDPTRIAKEKRDGALAVLREWSTDPYKRPNENSRMALHTCLTSGIQMDDGSNVVETFTAILEREDQENESCQRQELKALLKDILDQLGQTTARPSEVKQELITALGQIGGENEERIPPSDPAWINKLLDYYVAAYMDLMTWAVLENIPLGKSIHEKVSTLYHVLCLGSDDKRQVVKLLKDFQDETFLSYLARIETGGAFDAWRRNQGRRKT